MTLYFGWKCLEAHDLDRFINLLISTMLRAYTPTDIRASARNSAVCLVAV